MLNKEIESRKRQYKGIKHREEEEYMDDQSVIWEPI
jgi:hypothetical protein